MRGCNCGTVHEDAHAPGCSGFAVEYHRLTADNALLRADIARLREALKISVREMQRASEVGEVKFKTNALSSDAAVGLAEAISTARAALATDGEKP